MFSFTTPLNFNTENTMRTMPFPTDIAVQFTGDNPINMIRLRFDEWLGKSLGNRQLFNAWLQSQISMDVYYAYLNKYLIIFLIIVLFHLTTILWKHAKDGNKRSIIW
jgi:hypothetical protein